MKKITLSFLFFVFVMTNLVQAQASLSVQGTIQKSFGAAVEDGEYSLTFKLYTTDTGGTPVWSETQDAVEVIGGVYSVILGEVNPLNAAFDETYYLGISVEGGTELSPRARLTSSPYALSLIGQNNKFPSTGTVGIGTATPDEQQKLHVLGNTKLEGDLEVTGTVTGIEVDFENITQDIHTTGSITPDAGLNLPAGQSISYAGLKGWRLVEVDDFSADAEGWSCQESFNQGGTKTFQRFSPNTPFSEGYILRPDQAGNDVLFKQFDLTGIPHTQVKVVFTYHYFDTWGETNPEIGWAAFSTTNVGTAGSSNGQFQCGWIGARPHGVDFGGAGYSDFWPGGADYNVRAEMMAQDSDDTFYVLFGANLNQSSADESYGISNIEIWVR